MSGAEPPPGPGDGLSGPGEVPEVAVRLPGRQAERLPSLLLHLRRRVAVDLGQQ